MRSEAELPARGKRVYADYESALQSTVWPTWAKREERHATGWVQQRAPLFISFYACFTFISNDRTGTVSIFCPIPTLGVQYIGNISLNLKVYYYFVWIDDFFDLTFLFAFIKHPIFWVLSLL